MDPIFRGPTGPVLPPVTAKPTYPSWVPVQASVGESLTLNSDWGGFRYPDPAHPLLAALRARYPLTAIIAGASNPFEAAQRLNGWVHSRWTHQNQQPEKGDALSILAEAETGKGFPCYAYARVLNACLNAVGIPARTVGLKTQDVETRAEGAGHVVVEAYMSHLGQWALLDPTMGAVFLKDGVPLSVPGLTAAMAEAPESVTLEVDPPAWNNPACKEWMLHTFLKPYLFYWDVKRDQLDSILGQTEAPGLLYVPPNAPVPRVFQQTQSLTYNRPTHDLTPFQAPPPPQEKPARKPTGGPSA